MLPEALVLELALALALGWELALVPALAASRWAGPRGCKRQLEAKAGLAMPQSATRPSIILRCGLFT